MSDEHALLTAADPVKPPASVDWAIEGPELLAALIDMTCLVRKCMIAEGNADWAVDGLTEKARAAIASATGETGA